MSSYKKMPTMIDHRIIARVYIHVKWCLTFCNPNPSKHLPAPSPFVDPCSALYYVTYTFIHRHALHIPRNIDPGNRSGSSITLARFSFARKNASRQASRPSQRWRRAQSLPLRVRWHHAGFHFHTTLDADARTFCVRWHALLARFCELQGS